MKLSIKSVKRMTKMLYLRALCRDLKPENLIMTSDDNNADLKIVDFGFAAFDTGGKHRIFACVIACCCMLLLQKPFLICVENVLEIAPRTVILAFFCNSVFRVLLSALVMISVIVNVVLLSYKRNV